MYEKSMKIEQFNFRQHMYVKKYYHLSQQLKFNTRPKIKKNSLPCSNVIGIKL